MRPPAFDALRFLRKIAGLISRENHDARQSTVPEGTVRGDVGDLEGVMNSAEKPHRNADYSVSSVLRRSPVFRISKPFLNKFITPSRDFVSL